MRAATGAAEEQPNLPLQDCRAIAAELPQAGAFCCAGRPRPCRSATICMRNQPLNRAKSSAGVVGPALLDGSASFIPEPRERWGKPLLIRDLSRL